MGRPDLDGIDDVQKVTIITHYFLISNEQNAKINLHYRPTWDSNLHTSLVFMLEECVISVKLTHNLPLAIFIGGGRSTIEPKRRVSS
jgi:hypothetical protein